MLRTQRLCATIYAVYEKGTVFGDIITMNRKCKCESGLPVRELIDAAGIYVALICDKCENEVRSKYRPEIFDPRSLYALRGGEEDDILGDW